MVKRLVLLLLALGMLTVSSAGISEQAVSGAVVSDETGRDSQHPDADVIPETITTVVDNIKSSGNLVLGISATGLLALGYDYADIITVTLLGQEMEMPVVSSFSEVENGCLLCRAEYDEARGRNTVTLALNASDLATSMGIATKVDLDADPAFRWDYLVPTPVEVTISMKEKGGYANEYMLRQLKRTNERADYPNLTDEQYANFRNIATTGMGALALYRSTSPINPDLNRNREADEALNNAGIQTIINLIDSAETARGFDGYSSSYYSQRDMIALAAGLDFTNEENQAKLAEGLTFMAAHEGPYLIHCKEGKDRTGFVSALLECLMGATAEEIIADYMITYYNFYGVEPGTEKYDAIERDNLEKNLRGAFGVEDIRQADLALCAENYLRSIGLSDETISALKTNLARSYAE